MKAVTPMDKRYASVPPPRDADDFRTPVRGVRRTAASALAEAADYFDEDELALLDRVAKHARMVVWDWDLTVLSIHSYGMRIHATDIRGGLRGPETLVSDFTDLPFFTALALALHERGVKVCVASFGQYATIQAYCDFIFGVDSKLFTRENINTPGVVGGTDGCTLAGGKNLQLEHLCRTFGVAKEDVLFYDDDGRNIDHAKDAGYPYSFHADGGFTQELWSHSVARLLADREEGAAGGAGGAGGGGGGAGDGGGGGGGGAAGGAGGSGEGAGAGAGAGASASRGPRVDPHGPPAAPARDVEADGSDPPAA